jgi:hypothetical protein
VAPETAGDNRYCSCSRTITCQIHAHGPPPWTSSRAAFGRSVELLPDLDDARDTALYDLTCPRGSRNPAQLVTASTNPAGGVPLPPPREPHRLALANGRGAPTAAAPNGAMTLYSESPEWRPFAYDKPTLLVCWWSTIFCATIILLRVCGRYIRTERLFMEDKTAAIAVIPLFLRMGCVHAILVYGTNNISLEGREVSEEEIRHRQIASGLVLASRILYALTYVTPSH